MNAEAPEASRFNIEKQDMKTKGKRTRNGNESNVHMRVQESSRSLFNECVVIGSCDRLEQTRHEWMTQQLWAS